MTFSASVHRFQDRMYTLAVSLTWVLYLSVAFGLSASAPEYLSLLQNAVKTYVSLYLLYRFNPFRRVHFTALDARITFSAGMFLFVSMLLSTTWGVHLLQLPRTLLVDAGL